MLKKIVFNLCIVVTASLGLVVCSPSSDEAVIVKMPASAAPMASLSCVTNLGWTVEVSSFIVSFSDLAFTIEGETHTAMTPMRWLQDQLVPSAVAHPGHYGGGDVTGELLGSWVVDFAQDNAVPLGTASLLEGDYNGVNMTFQTAAESDVTPETERVTGHTAYVAGSASKNDETILFEVFIDIEDGLQVVGGVFEMDVLAGISGSLALSVVLDPETGVPLFDDIDFSSLTQNDDGVAVARTPEVTHNVLMKALQIHDYWVVVGTEQE